MTAVTIINIDGKVKKKNPAFVENKTVEQILKSFPHLKDHNQYALAIKTPAYIKVLRPESKPTDKYPDLIVEGETDMNSIPEFSLIILNKSEQGKIFLTFDVSSTNKPDIIFPTYSFGFLPQTYSNKHLDSFIKDLQDNFGFPITNPRIFLNKKQVSPDEYVRKVLCDTGRFITDHIYYQTKIKSDPIEFKFEIGAQGLQMIRLREKTLDEILQTERTYFLTINNLYHHFGKLFKQNKVVNDEDYQLIFGPIPKMIETSAKLTAELEKQTKYSSCVSLIFSEFLFDFQRSSQDYFVNYNQKTNLITENLDSKPIVKQICTQTPGYKEEGNIITFQMMAIQPIQRFPRYIILLKQLLSYTPPSHPDFSALKDVMKQLDKMVSEMESAHLYRSVKSIQERLIKNNEKQLPSIVTKDRILFNEFKVFTKGKKKTLSTLYLFNDLILLTMNNEQEENQEQELMRNEYDKFIFIPNYNDNLTILYYFNEEYKTIEFKSTEQIQKFHHDFNELRTKIQENKSRNDLPSIKSNEYFPPKEQIIPSMIDTSCCKIGNLISSISHKTYITYDTSHKSLTVQEEIKNTLKDSKIVAIDTIPYIFGGLKKPGPYELRNNKFEECKPKSSIKNLALIEKVNGNRLNSPIEGRIYHTCCAYDKFIVVYGGINPRKNKHFNDVYFYSVETGEWFSTESTNKTKNKNRPESRYKHSSVVYKNVMIIHGGISCINDKALKDTWLFNFNDGQWTMINTKNDQQVIPRFGHLSVIVNRFMFIISGSTISNSDNNPSTPFRLLITKKPEKKIDDKTPDNFPDTESSDKLDEESDNSSLTTTIHSLTPLFMSESIAASDGFCLNIENGDLVRIIMKGNFLHGLSQSSAIYDDKNEQIVVFGGTDPQNKLIKGTPIIYTLDIPKYYKLEENKPPPEPVDIEKLISFTPTTLGRKKSLANFYVEDGSDASKKKSSSVNKPKTEKAHYRSPKKFIPTIVPIIDPKDEHKAMTPQVKKVAFDRQQHNEYRQQNIGRNNEKNLSQKSDTNNQEDDAGKRRMDNQRQSTSKDKNTDSSASDSDGIKRIHHHHHNEDDAVRKPVNRHFDDNAGSDGDGRSRIHHRHHEYNQDEDDRVRRQVNRNIDINNGSDSDGRRIHNHEYNQDEDDHARRQANRNLDINNGSDSDGRSRIHHHEHHRVDDDARRQVNKNLDINNGSDSDGRRRIHHHEHRGVDDDVRGQVNRNLDNSNGSDSDGRRRIHHHEHNQNEDDDVRRQANRNLNDHHDDANMTRETDAPRERTLRRPVISPKKRRSSHV